MYPDLIRIGSFEITSFGVMLAVAALTSLWLFRRELRRSNLPDSTVDAAVLGLVGGLAGAKIVWSVEHASTAPFAELLFARGGLSWYGGLAGGLIVGLSVLSRKRVPLLAVVAAATPAFAFGHLLGRLGCFLVGDDYGIPSDLPWAVAFPEGLPPTTTRVHPTQLYEAIGLGVLGFYLLRWRRRGLSDSAVVGRYPAGAGMLRFAIEFIRTHEEILLGLAVAHLFSIVMVIVGVVLMQPRDPWRKPQVRGPRKL